MLLCRGVIFEFGAEVEMTVEELIDGDDSFGESEGAFLAGVGGGTSAEHEAEAGIEAANKRERREREERES